MLLSPLHEAREGPSDTELATYTHIHLSVIWRWIQKVPCMEPDLPIECKAKWRHTLSTSFYVGRVTSLSKWCTFSQGRVRGEGVEPNIKPCHPLRGDRGEKSLQKQTFVVFFLSRLWDEKVLLKQEGACVALCSFISQIELGEKRFILMPPSLAFLNPEKPPSSETRLFRSSLPFDMVSCPHGQEGNKGLVSKCVCLNVSFILVIAPCYEKKLSYAIQG